MSNYHGIALMATSLKLFAMILAEWLSVLGEEEGWFCKA